MNRLTTFVLLTSVLLGVQATQAALPDASLTGSVIVKKGRQLSCKIKVDVADNKAAVDLSPGNLLCNMVSFNGGPYDIEVNGATVKLKNVDVATLGTGGCAGDIEAQWDGTTLTIDTNLPSKNSGPACIVKGTARAQNQ